MFSVTSDLLDSPSLGVGQDLLADCPSITDLMGLVELLGISQMFVSDAMCELLSPKVPF